MRKLSMADIADVRAYERERPAFRARIIETKKRRRIALGSILTLTFESTDTMRFQVQEMARAERMLHDEQILEEIETYNALVPDDGCLVATLFVELTSKAQLQEWLPKLVGIQRAVRFRLADGTTVEAEPQDEERLTRDDVTASVHYLTFRFADGASLEGASIVADHPAYRAEVTLGPDQVRELQGDLSAAS